MKSWQQDAELIVGPGNLGTPSEWLEQRGWDGPLPKAIAFPSTREQVCELLLLATAERLPVMPAGNGTKLRLGGPARHCDLIVSLARVARIVDYPASDLTISVEAGLPVRDLAAALAAQGQTLPLDVPFAGLATVGGMIAANSSGPQRLGRGSWRDLVLGVQFVTAEGKIAKGGGKVVKNVAGYDLPKLLIGSLGTLGIIVEITLKVLPAPPLSATFVMRFAKLDQALQAARELRRSPLAPQAMELLDEPAGLLAAQEPAAQSPFTLLVAAAGSEEVLRRFERELPSLLHSSAPLRLEDLRGAQEASVWRLIQELTPELLHRNPGAIVIRASLPLTQMSAFLDAAARRCTDDRLRICRLARAGLGIVYCHLWADSGEPEQERAGRAGEFLVSIAEQLGGRAVVEWCPERLKSTMNLWGALGDDFALMRGVKAALDPLVILNPGRFYGGI